MPNRFKSGYQRTMHRRDMAGDRCQYSGRIVIWRNPSSIQRSNMRLNHSCHRPCNRTASVVQQLVGRQGQHRFNRILWQVDA